MTVFIQRDYNAECPSELKDAINANSSITPECIQVVVDQSGSPFITYFEFVSAPDAGEETELDSMIYGSPGFECIPSGDDPVDDVTNQDILDTIDDQALGEHRDVTDSNFTSSPRTTSTTTDQQYILKGNAGGDGYDVVTLSDGGVTKPTGLTEWHDVQAFGDQHNVGNKFLDVTTSSTPSNESSVIMLQNGEIEHVTISTSRNPTDVGTIKIFKNATRGGAGQYAGGTQISADLDKTSGNIDKTYTNLSGYTFAAGDRISVYLESNPNNLFQPVVKLFIRYD